MYRISLPKRILFAMKWLAQQPLFEECSMSRGRGRERGDGTADDCDVRSVLLTSPRVPALGSKKGRRRETNTHTHTLTGLTRARRGGIEEPQPCSLCKTLLLLASLFSCRERVNNNNNKKQP